MVLCSLLIKVTFNGNRFAGCGDIKQMVKSAFRNRRTIKQNGLNAFHNKTLIKGITCMLKRIYSLLPLAVCQRANVMSGAMRKTQYAEYQHVTTNLIPIMCHQQTTSDKSQ